MNYKQLSDFLEQKYKNRGFGAAFAVYDEHETNKEISQETLNKLKILGLITEEEIAALNGECEGLKTRTGCFDHVFQEPQTKEPQKVEVISSLEDVLNTIFGFKNPVGGVVEQLFGKEALKTATKVANDIFGEILPKNPIREETVKNLEGGSLENEEKRLARLQAESEELQVRKSFYEDIEEILLEKLEAVEDWHSKDFTLIHKNGLKVKNVNKCDQYKKYHNVGVLISWGEDELENSVFVSETTIGSEKYLDLITAYNNVVAYLKDKKNKKSSINQQVKRLKESFLNSI